MKIFLDFGHGGSDSGAVSNGLVEKTMNLVTGLECKKVLESNGIEVATSRLDDRYVDLSERARMANAWGANYFVSIHYNSGGGDGVEAIHSISGGKGEALAKAVVNSINKRTAQNLRGKPTYSRIGSDGKDYYAVIRETNMDSIIVESGFIDSADRALFDTPQEQQAMGKAIAYGILDFLGVAPTDNKTTYYRIVTGGFSSLDNLNVAINNYFKGINIYIKLDRNNNYYIETGDFNSREEANNFAQKFAKDKYYYEIKTVQY